MLMAAVMLPLEALTMLNLSPPLWLQAPSLSPLPGTASPSRVTRPALTPSTQLPPMLTGALLLALHAMAMLDLLPCL